MKIVYSSHAENQIKRRKISKSFITKTIGNPEEIYTSFRNRKLLKRQIGSKILEVVVIEEKSQIVVITAYYVKM